MIAKMEKLAVYGLSGDRDRMLRGLMEKGCLELMSPETLEEYGEVAGLVQRRDLDIYELEGRLSRFGAAIAALSKYEKKPGLFTRKPRVAIEEYSSGDAMERAAGLCVRVEAGLRELSEMRAAVAADRAQIDSLTPWKELDLPLGVEETERADVRHMVYTDRAPAEEFEKAVEEAGGAAVKVSADGAGAYYLVLSYKPETEAVTAAARDFACSRASFPGMRYAPAVHIANLERDISDFEYAIEQVEQSLAEHAKNNGVLKQAYDATQLEIECAKAGGKLMSTEKTFVLTAWMPEKAKEKVEKLLEGFSCFYEVTEADQTDPEMPVLLESPKWVRPFECITEMYSLPLPGSLDPGPFLTPFYFIFFGMMLSDAGYGLLITIGCLVLLKMMDVGPSLKKLLQMLAACGVSAVIWGVLYGSYFGDVIETIARNYFGTQLVVPRLIDPMNQPIQVLVISMALGLVHIMLGMGLKAYLLIKRGHPWAALFDVGFWYFVFIGLIMLVAGGTVAEVGKWLAIAGAVGLVCTQGRDKKNLFGKITSGVLSLYDITGYLSDVLSYSRILALGLATAVIASVINTIGTLPGPNVLGIIFFLVVFVGGHAFNLAINALGSYVHTARLQYVEFFGKFYEGGGRPFRPLAVDTKYTMATMAGEEKE